MWTITSSEVPVAIRKVLKQPPKALKTEEGKEFLSSLTEYVKNFPEIEPLVPWMIQRFGKGELKVKKDGEIASTRNQISISHFIPQWVQWWNARQHPMRRGVNIQNLSVDEFTQLANDLSVDVRERQKAQNWVKQYGDTGKVVYQFNQDPFEGWTVHQLQNAQDCEAESEALGHCIGYDSQNYKSNISNGEIEAFSLRDKYGFPKVTWHFNPDGTLAHLQGSSGDPKQSYRDLISEFNNATDRDDDDGGEGHEEDLGEQEAEEITLPPADSIEGAYAYIDSESLYDAAVEYANENDIVIGEGTEINVDTPDWQEVADSALGASERDYQDFHTTFARNESGRLHVSDVEDYEEALKDHIRWSLENRTTGWLEEELAVLNDFLHHMNRPQVTWEDLGAEKDPEESEEEEGWDLPISSLSPSDMDSIIRSEDGQRLLDQYVNRAVSQEESFGNGRASGEAERIKADIIKDLSQFAYSGRFNMSITERFYPALNSIARGNNRSVGDQTRMDFDIPDSPQQTGVFASWSL